MKKEKGITLIALVITIIVLLILAGITINFLFSDNGIIKKATDAKNRTIESQLKEKLSLEILNNQIQSIVDNKVNPDFLNQFNFVGLKKITMQESIEQTGKCIIEGIIEEENNYFDLNLDITIRSENQIKTDIIALKIVEKLEKKYEAFYNEIQTGGLRSESQYVFTYKEDKFVIYQEAEITEEKIGITAYVEDYEEEPLTSVTKVAAGANMHGLIDQSGKVWTWNKESIGETYITQNGKTIQLERINLGKNKIIDLSIGNNYATALDENGNVWTWGNNSHGQLGHDLPFESPYKVMISQKITKVVAGKRHVMALDIDGNVWVWGDNYYGQLGYELSENLSQSKDPTKINIGNKKIVDIAAGGYFSMALDEDGNVWTWGNNESGQLGYRTINSKRNILPTKVEKINKGIKKIAIGGHFSLALDVDGNVWSWGGNYSKQLGYETLTETNYDPKQITTIGKRIQNIEAGWNHSVALDEEGKIWTWGDNYFGQLGYETLNSSDNYLPTIISSVTEKIIQISGKEVATILLDKNNKMYFYGDDNGVS